jgi:heavy metal sensor kinase
MPPRGPGPDEAGGIGEPPDKLRLSPGEQSLFEGGNSNAYYFVLWRRDGVEMLRSKSAPASISRPARGFQSGVRVRGDLRELYDYTPPGECILVGCNLTGEFAEMRRLSWLLLSAGGAVLLLGLAGGWWFSTRAISPIEDISKAAGRISQGDLSQRINVADTDNELGRLAGVLNSTFARLETAFGQQRQFSADAAHELRTPVSVMLTQTQTALNRERTPAEYRQTLEACQRAAQRMRGLIESLLALARLDAGQEQFKRLKVDLAQVARDSAEMVQPLADERGIKLSLDLSPLPCIGDSERLGQVISNLLTNAIEYNKPNGEVTLRTEANNGTVTLIVSDTGKGIAPEDLPRVFERFYRADQSRTGSHTGLGLAICKAIVEAHGGSLEVSSELCAGTTFTVRLPA